MTPANRSNSTPATNGKALSSSRIGLSELPAGRLAPTGDASAPSRGADRPDAGASRRLLGSAVLCLAGLLPACGEPSTTGATGSSDGAAADWVTSDDPMAEQVQDLVDDLAAETTGGARAQDAWHDRVRATLERMERADPDLGRAVIQLLDQREDLDPGLRARLLDAASRAMSKEPGARGELADFLTSRIETYGRALGERNQASELIGVHCPERAVEVLAPLLLPDRRSTTLPDREFMLRGYLDGAERTGTDPHDLLCEIALEKRLDHITRKIALRELVPIATPRSIAVFESVMSESSGDALLRGVAVNCFTKVVPKERAIERLEELAELEAEINMQILLANTLASLRGER